jgi:hypothetical protein
MFKELEKQARHFDGQFHQALNKLEAAIARHWPELTLYLKLAKVTLLELLAAYGGPQAVADNASEAMRLMRKTGGSKLAQSKIEHVVDSARQTVGVRQIPSEQMTVQLLAQDALRTRKSRDQIKKDLEKQAEELDKVNRMSKTVGLMTAAVVYAKIGSPSEFPNAASFEKSAGGEIRKVGNLPFSAWDCFLTEAGFARGR